MILESNWKSNGLEIRWNTDGILIDILCKYSKITQTRQYHTWNFNGIKWNLDGKLMESSGSPDVVQIYDFGQIT